MNPWGAIIREVREAEGLTQAELAELADIKPSVLSRIEAGKVGIEPAVYDRLINALRSLKPVELARAIGYHFTVPLVEQIPVPMARDLLSLDREELAAVGWYVHQLATRTRPQGKQSR